jgi:hypothetical protein
MDECDSGPGRHRSGANAALVCADASAAITSHIVCVRKKKVRTRKKKTTGFYYGAQSMRTMFIVITAFNVVPSFVFCTTKTHVIVHLYSKIPHLIVSWA